MLFLFQGCLGLSFRNWTGLISGLTMDRITGLQELLDYKNYWIRVLIKQTVVLEVICRD